MTKKELKKLNEILASSFNETLQQSDHKNTLESPPDFWSAEDRMVFDILNEFLTKISAGINEELAGRK